jgi:hypothetical protein
MMKRTFVLFFCLAQFLAFSLLPDQSGVSYAPKTNTESFSPRIYAIGSLEESHLECEDVCHENAPIIQADDNDFEWKECLSDLLRHRNLSYRFITFESVVSTFFQFTSDFRVTYKSVHRKYLFKAGLTLPDYYSFLHRLCPF